MKKNINIIHWVNRSVFYW